LSDNGRCGRPWCRHQYDAHEDSYQGRVPHSLHRSPDCFSGG